jgi:TatD DNase family protein
VRLFDSHSHLDVAEFDADRNEVLARAHAAGVEEQLVPAVDHDSWPGLRDVCAATPGLHPAYGLHPVYLSRHRPEHLQALGDWIERERPRAVGEIGLDFFIEGLDPEQQRHYFQAQLQLARDFDLPVVVHARRAVEEVTQALRRTGGLRGVIHSYSGSVEQARQLFELGFMIGIGGPLTYDRARRMHRLVAGMPLEFLLLETDSPDQPDAAHRGQRNEPARIGIVLDAVARLREASADSIAEATRANARRLLRLD